MQRQSLFANLADLIAKWPSSATDQTRVAHEPRKQELHQSIARAFPVLAVWLLFYVVAIIGALSSPRNATQISIATAGSVLNASSVVVKH